MIIDNKALRDLRIRLLAGEEGALSDLMGHVENNRLSSEQLASLVKAISRSIFLTNNSHSRVTLFCMQSRGLVIPPLTYATLLQLLDEAVALQNSCAMYCRAIVYINAEPKDYAAASDLLYQALPQKKIALKKLQKIAEEQNCLKAQSYLVLIYLTGKKEVAINELAAKHWLMKQPANILGLLKENLSNTDLDLFKKFLTREKEQGEILRNRLSIMAAQKQEAEKNESGNQQNSQAP